MIRVFHAPRELVFCAFAEPEHVRQWCGPTGWTISVCTIDFRPGGEWHYCIANAAGEEHCARTVYHTIVPPQEIVFSDAMVDAQGKVMKECKIVKKVTSNDGTQIAYDVQGAGPAVILVTGAIARRTDAAALSGKLAPSFKVYSYDRRGRGDSGDTPPYAVEREVEDIGALINLAGGSAFVFGHSSGAVLAMEAAAAFQGIRKLAVYEPPFIVDDSRPPVTNATVERLAGLLSANRRSDMLAFWMTGVVGVPAEFVTQMRQQPSWAGMERTAHTLLYDIAIMKDSETGPPLPPGLIARLASIHAATLVMAGGASPQWMRSGAQAAVQAIPGAKYRVMEGQTHGVADDVLVPVLVEFFT